MDKLLVVAEVLDLLRISLPTLDRRIRLTKRGESSFPLPVQDGAKRKRLWHMTDIERWANRQSSTPVKKATVVSPKQQRRTEKLYQERQASARQALAERHGIITNPKKSEK